MSMGESYLVAGILFAFPLAGFYRYLIPRTSPRSKDLFLALTGTLLYFFCFGLDAMHVIALTLLPYLFMCAFGISAGTCCVVFFSALAHLLYGYIAVSGISYTVTWTLIHCQATLKVIGYFLDQYDAGASAPGSPLTYAAYVFFPFTSLVGPQFQFYRYVKFRENMTVPDSVKFSAECVGAGVVYIAVFYAIKQFTSTDILISETFQSYPLPLKLVFLTFWSKWLITKYGAIWCIAEGAASLTGIGADTDEAGQETWGGLTNIDVRKFELSLTIQDELTSFNVQTHHWVKRNVYKRCKILGSPVISRVLSLLFLYLWHGIYIGFLNLFLVEALGISSEEALSKYVSREKLARYVPRSVLVVLQYLLKNMCVGYGLCGFALRSADRCHVFYSSIYYCFHWGMVLWLVVEVGVVRRFVKGKRE